MDGSVFHPPLEISAALTERLLEAMKANPGASASALAGVLEISKNAIAARWNRLGREGVLIKCADGRWRLPSSAEPDEEASEFEAVERSPPVPAFDPSRWVQHVDRFLRTETGLFDCRRLRLNVGADGYSNAWADFAAVPSLDVKPALVVLIEPRLDHLARKNVDFPASTDAERRKRFVETARKVGALENIEDFDKAFSDLNLKATRSHDIDDRKR